MNHFERLLIGNSPEFQAVIRSAQVVSALDVTVLVNGESGTGKELLAQALHGESPRADAPFITINCAALPETLAESELFGHRKGAFTGADSDQPGKVRSADGGTLFLDEVGELPLNVQAKLLRFLESGECQPLGEQTSRKVNVRVIAATHRDLLELVREGRFREDLYYRLNVIPLELPPLRQRQGDIAQLAQTLTAQLAERHNLPAPSFKPCALKVLADYSWPGNVRELRNLCERMVILLSGQQIEASNLPPEFKVSGALPGTEEGIHLPEQGLRMDEVEQTLIQQALSRTNGNRSRAARLLGLTRDTLLYRIKKYALES